jgi:tetratricopeptide (TPR) repeat protein
MKKFFLLWVMVFICVNHCFALGWKDLHERADKTALQDALVSVKNNPGSVEDLYLLGLIYLHDHRDQEAKEVFNNILAIMPQETAAKWGLSETLRREHRFDESENMLEEITILSPGLAPAFISRAYIRYSKADFEGALKYAQRAISLGSGKLDTSNLVRAYLMLAGAKGMIAHYGGIFSKLIYGATVFSTIKKAESIQPDSPEVLFGLGSFYLLAPKIAGGNIDKAIDYLERAVRADPFFADSYARLAQAYKIKGDKDKYDTYLSKALEIDPQDELAIDIKNGSCRFICIEK